MEVVYLGRRRLPQMFRWFDAKVRYRPSGASSRAAVVATGRAAGTPGYQRESPRWVAALAGLYTWEGVEPLEKLLFVLHL